MQAVDTARPPDQLKAAMTQTASFALEALGAAASGPNAAARVVYYYFSARAETD